MRAVKALGSSTTLYATYLIVNLIIISQAMLLSPRP